MRVGHDPAHDAGGACGKTNPDVKRQGRIPENLKKSTRALIMCLIEIINTPWKQNKGKIKSKFP